jgi:hypothetical protein
MIGGVFEFGRWCKMGVNVEITKLMRISRQQSPRSITAGECGVFQQFGWSDNEWYKMYT